MLSDIDFLFFIDYPLEEFIIYPLAHVPSGVYYDFEGFSNYPKSAPLSASANFTFSKNPIDYPSYEKVLLSIHDEIRQGNGYLFNVTFPTPIQTNMSFEEIFANSQARFKVLHEPFVCFSPERFVQIKNNTISTYPIKGTIASDKQNATTEILNSEKELAEHTMVTDLLRNDLSIIGTNTRVEQFRYIDTIKAGEKELLQVTSKISSDLEEGWQHRLDAILLHLLPAGSISGTPKKNVCQILEREEPHKRGFFSGVCGYYKDKELDSFVMIRFIEKIANTLIYKSGGGITSDSDIKSEYEEMIEKVYVPIF